MNTDDNGMRIFKYPLQVTDVQYVSLPLHAKLLTVQVQNGIPCLWALVDSKHKLKVNRPVFTIGTGNPAGHVFETGKTDEWPKYLSTYQLANGALVFHVFYQ